MHGEVSEIQIAGFLIALRTKGETVEELAGLARTMRALAAHVPTEREDLLDTAGTGGGTQHVQRLHDGRADRRRRGLRGGQARQPLGHQPAPGRPICSRRWARASTSTPEGVARCIDEAGFGFMFAPAHHQATRFVVPVRRELAVRTIFNLLGPLTNPAGARRQLIGVSDARFLETIAGALARLGVDRALVVAGEDGLDEISIGAPTQRGGGQRARSSPATRSTPDEVGIELSRRAGALRRGHARGERRAHARDPRGRSRGSARPRRWR